MSGLRLGVWVVDLGPLGFADPGGWGAVQHHDQRGGGDERQLENNGLGLVLWFEGV